MANISELTAKVNLDAEEAIKGLKAIHREAKEATKALRELEKVKSTKKEQTMKVGNGEMVVQYTDEYGVPRTLRTINVEEFKIVRG